jgi:hypothetical protein
MIYQSEVRFVLAAGQPREGEINKFLVGVEADVRPTGEPLSSTGI